MSEFEHDFDDKEYWEKKIQGFTGFESVPDVNAVWDYFKYCLQTQNRFFFEHPLLPLVTELFRSQTFILQEGESIYRARIDHSKEYENQCWIARDYIRDVCVQTNNPDSPFVDYYKNEALEIAGDPEYQNFLVRNAQGFEGFDAKGSGVPPYESVAAGRCNPERVVFLYAASDIYTATAEVRPYIRDAVSIATLNVEKKLSLVDFYYEYDESGARTIDNLLFDKMRMEFSALNKGNKDEYLVTQYLALLAQQQGFDGIRFRSSLVEQGTNYVIFDAGNCVPISSKMYIVKKVEYNLFTMLQEHEKEVIK